VLRDIGDKIVNTGGVAVRPFWWSNECLEALGLKTYVLGPGKIAAEEEGDSGVSAAGLYKSAGSPLSTVLIALVAIMSLLLLAAAVYLIKLSKKKRMISVVTPNQDYQTPQPSTKTPQLPVYCSNCGSPLASGSNFCPKCGNRIRAN
jgi:hypothetical protein